MPIPNLITDLTTTAATNSPAGGESVTTTDDYLRAQASFIAKLRDDAVGLYKRTNIIATVSQTAGVPTGGLLERGSNANGEYTRFADGTQICFMSFPTITAVPINAAVATSSRSFPAVFGAIPAVAMSCVPVTSTDIYGVISSNVTLNGITPIVRNGGTVAQDITSIFAIAIGRWF